MLSDVQVQQILDAVAEMRVDLPLAVDFLTAELLQEKILEVRNHDNNVQYYYRQIISSKRVVEAAYQCAQLEYDVLYDETLVSDAVLRYSSAKDRESKTKTILKDHKRALDKHKRDLTDLKHLETITKAKINELKSVSQDIQKLRSLMRDGNESKSYYGSEYTDSIRSEPKDLKVSDEVLLEGVRQKPDPIKFDDLHVVSATDHVPVPSQHKSEASFEDYFDDLS
jgi:hypothetical protein